MRALISIKIGLQSKIFFKKFHHFFISHLIHRTTTLNDIYQSMGINGNSIDEDDIMKASGVNRQDQFIDDNIDDEYEEGEVSGYVVQKPLPPSHHGGINSFNPNVSFYLLLLNLFQRTNT